jgi:Ca-activated chloride channel homolog
MLRPVFVCATLLIALVASAQDPAFTVRVDVPLVTLDVQVFDANGRPVSDLNRDDFSIYEDGKPQEIRTFSPVDTPYNILLLIDRSGSMQDHWPLMEPAMARLLASLKPQDRISIGAFDERSKDVELLLDWRDAGNGASLQIPINPVGRGHEYFGISLSPGSSGSISYPSKDFYRALEWAVQRLSGVRGRKGAIVFSDGMQPRTPVRTVTVDDVRSMQLVDGRDDGDFRKLLRTISGGQARFDFVAVNTDLNPKGGGFSAFSFGGSLSFGMSVRLRLEQLAAGSGGRVAFPKRVEDTLTLYERIARELGTSYTLGYLPSVASKDGAYHRIEIRPRRDGLKVQQSRDGYSAP